jgi:hypothetical protein
VDSRALGDAQGAITRIPRVSRGRITASCDVRGLARVGEATSSRVSRISGGCP